MLYIAHLNIYKTGNNRAKINKRLKTNIFYMASINRSFKCVKNPDSESGFFTHLPYQSFT